MCITCIACGNDDAHVEEHEHWWVRVDGEVGLCSECTEFLRDWESGARTHDALKCAA